MSRCRVSHTKILSSWCDQCLHPEIALRRLESRRRAGDVGQISAISKVWFFMYNTRESVTNVDYGSCLSKINQFCISWLATDNSWPLMAMYYFTWSTKVSGEVVDNSHTFPLPWINQNRDHSHYIKAVEKGLLLDDKKTNNTFCNFYSKELVLVGNHIIYNHQI